MMLCKKYDCKYYKDWEEYNEWFSDCENKQASTDYEEYVERHNKYPSDCKFFEVAFPDPVNCICGGNAVVNAGTCREYASFSFVIYSCTVKCYSCELSMQRNGDSINAAKNNAIQAWNDTMSKKPVAI